MLIQCLIFIYNVLQKEKVKVYIDEKYHHAEDPSIRPPQKLKSLNASTENFSTLPPTTSSRSNVDPSCNVLSTSQMSTPKTAMRSLHNKPIRRQSFSGNLGMKSGANSRTSTLTRVNANTDDDYGKDIKNIPKATWKLLTNKIYIVTCLVRITTFGISTFQTHT